MALPESRSRCQVGNVEDNGTTVTAMSKEKPAGRLETVRLSGQRGMQRNPGQLLMECGTPGKWSERGIRVDDGVPERPDQIEPDPVAARVRHRESAGSEHDGPRG